jgi:hypothetical protein
MASSNGLLIRANRSRGPPRCAHRRVGHAKTDGAVYASG